MKVVARRDCRAQSGVWGQARVGGAQAAGIIADSRERARRAQKYGASLCIRRYERSAGCRIYILTGGWYLRRRDRGGIGEAPIVLKKGFSTGRPEALQE